MSGADSLYVAALGRNRPKQAENYLHYESGKARRERYKKAAREKLERETAERIASLGLGDRVRP